MNLIAIDTSTRWAGVGLQTGDGEQTEMIWRSDQNHGRELMPAIVELTRRAGLTPADITHLAVALGPGGFSAVRVGISTVIGLAMPRQLPVVGMGTHLVEAHPFREHASASSSLYSLLPAGRGELSWMRFDTAAAEPKTGLGTVEELTADIAPGTRFCGEGVELLRGHVKPELLLSGEPPTRSPSNLLAIATDRFVSGEVTPPHELRPIYARPPSITMKKTP